MAKYALFVEGQTELVFIRELLLKYFDYDVKIDCFKLHKEQLEKVPYSNQQEILPNNAVNYFLLVNVENDEKVLGAIKDRYENLLKSSYDKILGLRDIYCSELREIKNEYCDGTINSFVESKLEKFNLYINKNPQVILCFAKMEIESWLLGFYENFLRLLGEPNQNLLDEINIIFEEQNLQDFNFEREFHPANLLARILALLEIDYDKKYDEVAKLMATVHKDDFRRLYELNTLSSYNRFCSHLNLFQV